MTKNRRKEAAKKELERLENLELTGQWSIEGLALHGKRGSIKLASIMCADIDDEPTSEFQLLCQQADDTMRPHFQEAIKAYKKRLEHIAMNG